MDKNICLRLSLLIMLCSPAGGAWGQSLKPMAGDSAMPGKVFLMVLGNIQDAGSPHAGCRKDCCKVLFAKPDPHRKVVALGLIDEADNKKYLFEATPDITTQIRHLKSGLPDNNEEMPDGIFLTHAHIGHYAGLMYLGKEAADARGVPVYVMPRMDTFLRSNGPWSQLVTRRNIALRPLQHNQPIKLGAAINVTPLKVPHRDEYSETVGYLIEGPHKNALFIPDIDKWEKWDMDLAEILAGVDFAFIDATFYSGEEINNRNIAQIPHPFVTETMEKLQNLPAKEKSKIRFIHFNHTNPLLQSNSAASLEVLKHGFGIARFDDRIEL